MTFAAPTGRLSFVVRLLSAVLLAVVATGCSSDDQGGGNAEGADSPTTTAAPERAELTASLASYDHYVGVPQRLLIGLSSGTQLVSFGEVEITLSPPSGGEDVTFTAAWEPVPGGHLDEGGSRDGGQDRGSTTTSTSVQPSEPELVRPSEGIGVYVVRDVNFGTAGDWEATVSVQLDSDTRRAAATVPVSAEAIAIAPGDRAPATVNHLPGGEAPLKAVDSRAEEGGKVPDPSLHAMTVKDAIASGRPTVVVVSTPVYCRTRFCGPITDVIEGLATVYGDRANFIHLEVWREFDKQAVNAAAADWIYPTRQGGLNEPFTFLVDSSGTVVERWTNLATEADVDAALKEQLT